VYPGFSGQRPTSETRDRRLHRLLRGRPLDIPSWPRRQPALFVRRRLLEWGLFPFVRVCYSVRVRGRQHLASINEPCIIVSTHHLHLDQSLLLRAFTPRFRDRIAIAAAAQDIYGNRVRGFWASLLGNGFPFNREGSGVRQSLGTVARILADGWHVLIFPEGKLTLGGSIQPFKTGTGYLAVETGAPVLPVRIVVLRPGFREGRWFPTPRGKVEIRIGPPVTFAEGTSYAFATAALEQAVRNA
jgi:1-acyl-sn-glycerol-3-phosphate acyltransferase